MIEILKQTTIPWNVKADLKILNIGSEGFTVQAQMYISKRDELRYCTCML